MQKWKENTVLALLGFGKFFLLLLILSIGFASGSIYSAFMQNSKVTNKYFEVNPSDANLAANNPSALYTPISLASVVNKTADSVVEITQYTSNTNPFYSSSEYTSTGNGSGVIISNDGYIITNNHVISGASKIIVRLRSGDEFEAKLIGKDSKTDIAIVKIEASNLTSAVIGDSSKTLVGDFVLAIGNPLGKLGGTVTYGYVSALEREIVIDNSTVNLMQFDAAVNPGNSGGGLFNTNGELIGIVSAKSIGYDVEGLGFGIPVNDIKTVIDDLLTHGYAKNRAYLGIELSDSASALNNFNPYGGSLFDYFYQQIQYGARVEKVVENSPASKVDIKVGDIIISIGGKVVSSASAASAEVLYYNVGDEVEIGLIREGHTKTVKVVLGEYSGQ